MKRFEMPSVGIVHEWLVQFGGSERVVEQLLALYPQSQMYALLDFLPKADREMLHGREVHTTFLQRMPFAKKRFRGYLPLMPMAIEQLDLDAHDIIISSNHAVAKGVITGPDQLHICYTHTPMRYAWDLQHQYLKESQLIRGLRSMLARAILHYMRLWDCVAAQRVDVFVANSRFIAERIRKVYGRDAEVVYPPVDVGAFPMCRTKEKYYLTASRLVPYKKIDIIVEAFRRMPEHKLIVIGDGPLYSQIAAHAPRNVQMLGYQPHDALLRYMQHAKAFIFAAEEDFGIVPVEAQACGTPVVAYGRGGALETVIEGVTGFFFHEQTSDAIAEAVSRCESADFDFDCDRIRQNANRFSVACFRAAFSEVLQRHWRAFREKSRKAASETQPAEIIRPVEAASSSGVQPCHS